MALTAALFDTSVGLFVNKVDVPTGELNDSDLQREIDQVQLQLNALARSHLLSSITFFREGMFYLLKLRNKGRAVKDFTEVAHSGVGIEDREVEVYAGSPIDRMKNVSRELKDLNLTNLDGAGQRALSNAKDDFKQARIKAVEAFNNEVLTTSDRIQAMAIRVSATLLEKIDHPEDALEVCISCLEALHSIPEVQDSFSLEINKGYRYPFRKDIRRQIITSVCRINLAIRNAAVMIAKDGELLTLPLIESGEEKIDPLHDPRVADILRKAEMPHYVIVPLTLGCDEMNEEKRPKIPQGIAVNSQGHFIVGDEWDRNVKIFDNTNSFYRWLLMDDMDEENTIASIVDVATDHEDNVYVLVKQEEKSGTAARFKISVFEKEGKRNHDFFLREETTEVLRMTVNNYNEVLVLAENSEDTRCVVEVYKCDGGNSEKVSFGEETLNCAQDICATSDGRVIVLDRDDQCVMSVQVFHPNGQYIGDLFKSVEKAEKPITKLRSSIACHQASNSVVIAVPSEISQDKKEDPVRILKYDLNGGKFLPSIVLPMNGLVSTRGVAVTAEGRIAVGLLDKVGGNSKVLVV